MARAMYPSEILVGRKMPPERPYIDQLMASFVTPDGFATRLSPDESWLKPAHKKARKSGWLKYAGLRIKFEGERGPGSGLWYPTPAGEIEATAAKARVDKRKEERQQWAADHSAALRARAKGGIGSQK